MKLTYLIQRIFGLLVLLGSLSACQTEVSPPLTATVAPASPAPVTAPPVLPSATLAANTASPTRLPTATAPATAASNRPTTVPASLALPTAGGQSGPLQARAGVQQALKALADSSGFSYRVTQTGELDSAGSLSRFEAAGSGVWLRPAFFQVLEVKLDGQVSHIEDYSAGPQLFERMKERVVWRKGALPLAQPVPDPALLEKAAGFSAGAPEDIQGQPAARFGWQVPAHLLNSGTGHIESLGVLSATGLYQPFLNDTAALAQASIWTGPAGQPLRYQVRLQLNAGPSKFSYQVVYDYGDFNAPGLKLEVPGDLPG